MKMTDKTRAKIQYSITIATEGMKVTSIANKVEVLFVGAEPVLNEVG